MKNSLYDACCTICGSPARAAGFLALWLILSGLNPSDLPTGLIAAAVATLASVHLLPPGQWRLRPMLLVRLAARFLRQSVVAGVDVARRALDPRLPLAPGFVRYHATLPPGPAQCAFATMTSLLPGTLPCGSDRGAGLLIHCLDVAQPVGRGLETEEALLIRVLGGVPP
jgi:multicomponent Na+:H+ antiporter subunit E